MARVLIIFAAILVVLAVLGAIKLSLWSLVLLLAVAAIALALARR